MSRRWLSAAPTLFSRMTPLGAAGLFAAGVLACGDPAVTALSPVRGVSLSPPNATLTVGSSLTLSADVRSENGNPLADAPVFWSSSDSTIAAVNASGVVSGRRAGQATIAATALGVSAVSTVLVRSVTTPPVTPPPVTPPPVTPPPVTPPPVTPPPSVQPVATVTLSPSSLTLEEEERRQITVTLRSATGAVLTGRSVAWTSSNDGVATVSPAGVVTAHKKGSAVITATSEGKRGTVSVDVKK